MTRFRIPNQHKETVAIFRRSAFFRDQAEAEAMESDVEETVAENIVCMLAPETDGRARQDALRVASGVPVGQSNWSALLEKPNPDIVKGDFLKRLDGTEFRVENVLWMQGSPIMQLHLKAQGVL